MQLHRTSRVGAGAGADAVAQQKRWGFALVNASVAGAEVACLNCDPDLFKAWVAQISGAGLSACGKNSSDEAIDGSTHGKHPNSPGYDEWASKLHSKPSSFLSKGAREPEAAPCGQTAVDAISVAVTYLYDMEAVRPRLKTLWANRRLVIGAGGGNPLHENLDFVEALVSLSRNAPMLTPPNCTSTMFAAPQCDALFSGPHKTTSGTQLKSTLDSAFGAQFLKEHTLNPKWDEATQRTHVQELLSALKAKYSFYYQKCLTHESAASSCDREASSELVGQMSCQPHDDKLSDDCVYAELRLCKKCTKTEHFFEYSRFHGALALLETQWNRNGVMGQCEEFSRAGHALLSALGYEARYVLDFTDHVWIEVRLPTGKEGKWVHADPSEGVLDNPLMYEAGWGKKLTLIFAFTPTSVEAVTRTYTADYNATIERRGAYLGEEELAGAIQEANDRLRTELPLRSWGYGGSTARSLEEVALWAHFEAR